MIITLAFNELMFKKWNSKGYKYVKSVWGKNSKNLFTRNYWFLCQNNCSWICFEKKTKEYAAVHYRHIHDAFAIFCQQSFEKKYFRRHLWLATFTWISLEVSSQCLTQKAHPFSKMQKFHIEYTGFKEVSRLWFVLASTPARLPG